MSGNYDGLSDVSSMLEKGDERGEVEDIERVVPEEEVLNLMGEPGNIYSENLQPMRGSCFDLTFKPTKKVTYKTIMPQVFACLSAASFHIPVGLLTAYSAILLDQLEHSNEIKDVTPDKATWIASLAVLVVPIASVITGILVDRIGRINTLKAASIPYITGWLLIALAPNVEFIMAGRAITGFALAMGTSPAIVYITEVAQPDLRGTLICLGPTMASFGMVLVYLAGWFLHWRIVAWISIVFGTLPFVLMYIFTPESPTWLISKGRHAEALEAYKIVSYSKNEGEVQRQIRRLEVQIARKSLTIKTKKISIPLSEYFKPASLKPFCIMSICFFFQQFTGIYVMIFYAVRIFQDIGSDINPNLLSVIVGIIRMTVGFVTSHLLYKFGRRILCLQSLFFMAVLMSLSGYFTFLCKEGVIGKEWLWIPITCLLLYICACTSGLLSIPWTMTAEVYPLQVRGMMQGLTISVAHVQMFVSIKSFYALYVIVGGSYGIQWLFACVCVIGFVVLYVILPETRQKTVEEIEAYFNENTIYLGKKETSVKSADGKNKSLECQEQIA